MYLTIDGITYRDLNAKEFIAARKKFNSMIDNDIYSVVNIILIKIYIASLSNLSHHHLYIQKYQIHME